MKQYLEVEFKISYIILHHQGYSVCWYDPWRCPLVLCLVLRWKTISGGHIQGPTCDGLMRFN